MKIVSVLTIATFALGLGAANAAEPFKLTQAQMDNVTAAGVKCHLCSVKKIDWRFKSRLKLDGNVAEADATAVAKGFNTLTLTGTFSETTPISSASQSMSTSATD